MNVTNCNRHLSLINKRIIFLGIKPNPPMRLLFAIILTLNFLGLQLYGQVQTGKASFYADKFEGVPTASGEKYKHNKLTGAHKTLPFGTTVRVTNLANNQSVEVTINDRGPYVDNRIIDLSKAAA